MQLLKKRGIIIFWALLLLDCYFIYTNNNASRIFTKPLLVPILGFYVFLNSKKNYYQTTKVLIFFAFIAAWLGDMLLMGSKEIFFISGMIAFATFHLLIATVFLRFNKIRLVKCQNAFLALLVYLFISYRLIKFLKDGLDGFQVPLIIYIVVMGIMVTAVFNQLESSNRRMNAMAFFAPAAILFVISDSTLALQKFKYFNEGFLSVIVMLAYGYSMNLFSEGFAKVLKGGA